MRHRAQNSQQSSGTGAGTHLTPATPQIPTQSQPTHDDDVQPQVEAHVQPGVEPRLEAPVVRRRPATEVAPAVIPATARWRASHLPRIFAGTVMALAALGTSVLGVRYAQSSTSDGFVSLATGLAIVVILWAIVIASTPQSVTLENSVLTVRNSRGSESFDLVDALQAVDVVGDPRTSHWAVLLHRANSTTVVLRHHDVIASELDPIVRHYRAIADLSWSERQSRFDR